MADLENTARISKYTQSVKGLLIPGTEEELSTQLATLEVSAGAQAAESLLKQWMTFSEFAGGNGLTKIQLDPDAQGKLDPTFESKIAEYQEKHPDTLYADVVSAVGKQEPELYRKHRVSHTNLVASSVQSDN